MPKEVEKLYILWDPKDGAPQRHQDGEYVTSGLLGNLGPNNVYLTTYAQYPAGAPRLSEMEVGQRIENVLFNLSGTRGCYEVHRVR